MDTNHGQIQIETPETLEPTVVGTLYPGGMLSLGKKDSGYPLIVITLTENNAYSNFETTVSRAKLMPLLDERDLTTNDNHKLHWSTVNIAGFKQYEGIIDYGDDKGLVVSIKGLSATTEPMTGEKVPGFSENEYLDIFKSFTFIESDSNSQSTQPTEMDQDPTFHMAVIGDSIAWGNGLNDENKYSYIIADWVKEKLGKPVDITVYAHSGAKISGESGESINPNLNSGTPTLKEQAQKIEDKDNLDLILVSGGINDVGVNNILDANTPSETIRTLSQSIQKDMMDLLTYLLDETNARIIVTGYYPLITKDSKLEWQDRAIAGLVATQSEKTTSQTEKVIITALTNPIAANLEAARYLGEGLANNIDSDSNLIANSDTFYDVSSNSLKKAVSNADGGKNRVIFIDPGFEQTNSYKASNSFLWKFLLELNGFKTNDEQYQIRADLVDRKYGVDLNPFDLDTIKNAENKINPIAHPNKEGATEYADSIKSFLDTPERLDWLRNGPGADSGASITQDSLNEPSSDIAIHTENGDTSSVHEPSSDTSTHSVDNDANTKPAYTKDGVNFISEERLEQNIRNGLANLGEYEKVKVPLDTIVIEASPE